MVRIKFFPKKIAFQPLVQERAGDVTPRREKMSGQPFEIPKNTVTTIRNTITRMKRLFSWVNSCPSGFNS